MIGSTILLVHPWTKETKQVPVESVSRNVVYVRWEMCGIYELHLATNVLNPRERSAKIRAIGKARWQAVDIDEVRKRVTVYLDGEDKAAVTARLREAHEASMPNPNPRIGK